MDRERFRAVVEESRRQLDAAVDGLDDAAWVEPGVVEDWSVADLLGHVTAWEQMALRHLEQGLRGEVPTGLAGATVDTYNAAEAARRLGWTPAQAREEAAATTARLRAALESTSDEQWAAMAGEGAHRRPLGDWVAGALNGPLGPGTHAAEHAAHIWAWREARARRCAEQIGSLAATRQALLDALAAVPADQMMHAGTDGAWPIGVMLAHLAAWDRQLARAIDAWLAGATPPEQIPDVDRFNAQVIEEARTQPLAAILIDLARSHEDLLAVVARAGGRDGAFAYPWGDHGGLRQAIVADTAGHEREHVAELVARRDAASAG